MQGDRRGTRALGRLLALLLSAWWCAGSWAANLSLTGQLDPNNPQDAFLYPFTLSAPASVTIQSWGFGGTLSATGGVNGNGVVIGPGGFDPYVSLFSGTGPTATFIASNDDGSCPPGTISAGGCFDSRLTANLPAGTYTLAVSSFLNMSFAENLGAGTLGDGFIGLGNFGGRTSAFAIDITSPALAVPARVLAFVPNGMTFGAQTVNIASGPMTVIVTSAGSAAVTTSTISIAGTNPGDFAAGGDCAAVTLAPGASCTLTATFKPTATGSRSAVITVNSDASNNPVTINVSGTGTNSAVAIASLSVSDINFGQIPLKGVTAQSFAVRNVGAAPLAIGTDALGGANVGDFTVASDQCAGQTLNPGNACTVNIEFKPQALGFRVGTFTVNSNASNNPATVALLGVGILPPPIPTLGHWALLFISLVLAVGGTMVRRRRIDA